MPSTAPSASDRAAGDEHGSGGPPLEHAQVLRDETLQHPRTVFQILKRHYRPLHPGDGARGLRHQPRRLRTTWPQSVTENSGRERTTCFAYAVGWTQHTLGAQFIRTAAILQLLLGNVGRPGGGIMALRGHASIQGSTDIPTLFNLLPGYLPMPMVGRHDTFAEYLDAIASKKQKGFWANADAYTVSLLKAWWGDAATRRERLGLRLPAPAVRPARHLPDRHRHARRTRSRATSCSARTRPSARPTAGCSGWAWRT